MIFWIPKLALFGQDLFTSQPLINANLFLIFAYMGLSVANLIFGIWTAVIWVECLAQVQGFSAWNAIGNIIMTCLSGVILVGIVMNIS